MDKLDHFMNWWQGLILGTLQGLTEYLPVSSSGHLAIAELIFGLHMPVSVDVLLHLATLIPTIWIFRCRIGRLVLSLWRLLGIALTFSLRGRQSGIPLTAELRHDRRYILLVLVATVATFVIAFPQKSLNLKLQPQLVATAFLVTGILLFFQHFLVRRRLQHRDGSNSLQESRAGKALRLAVYIGLAQGFAVLPGISRSGMTISVALLLGVPRREAGEFSFIVSIPIILGALLLDARELFQITQMLESRGRYSIVLAFLMAALSGFIALRLLLSLLRKGNFYLFSFYLFTLSAFCFWYFS